MGIEPMNPFITSKVLYQLSYSGVLGSDDFSHPLNYYYSAEIIKD